MDEREEQVEMTPHKPSPDPTEGPMEQPTPYVPRPRWQIVGAWILLLVMILGIALYYYWIAHRYV